MELKNGKTVVFKRPGALSQARLISKITKLFKGVDINALQSEETKEEEKLNIMNAILGDNSDELFSIIPSVSNISMEELDVDGEKAIGFDEAMELIAQAIQVILPDADTQEIMGNGPTPPKHLEAGMEQKENLGQIALNSFSCTYSENPTGGAQEISTKSALLTH